MAFPAVSQRMRIRARVSPALYSAMEPGDQVVADMVAQTGPSIAIDLAVSLCLVLASLADLALCTWRLVHGEGGADPLGATAIFGGVLALVPLWLRKPVFVVVTRRQVFCYRLNRFDTSGTPREMMFAVSLPSASITRTRWSLRYTGPDGKAIRFNSGWTRKSRQDLNDVVAALEASGNMVEPGRQPRPIGRA
jgi:hypothetical protein